MVFSDTLIEVDLSFLKSEKADGVAVVKRVPDPRRFGAAILDGSGRVTRLIEKPQEMTNNLVVVGFYYFREGEELIKAIEEQVRRGTSLKGEYFLADAVNILIENGHHFRVEEIETWLDAGTADSMFETNRYLLEHGNDNSSQVQRPGVAIIPPVYVDPTAEIKSSVIGPYASVGANCLVEDAVIRDAIIDDETSISSTVLEKSLVGSHVRIEGQIVHYNLGDNTWVKK
jgi:glucose-1-phosphate thymidylyltransferase